MSTDQDSLDGRTARRRRNRDTVIDAVLDAIEEGHTIPTIRQVAELAGVSERSIFRYFGDIDELLAAAVEAGVFRYRSHAQIADEGWGTIEDRIDALVEARLALWMRADALASLIRSRAPALPLVQSSLTETRRKLRDQAERHLGDFLEQLTDEDRDHALHMIEVVVSFESLQLQLDAGAGSDQARARWRYAVRKLLTPLGPAEHPGASLD